MSMSVKASLREGTPATPIGAEIATLTLMEKLALGAVLEERVRKEARERQGNRNDLLRASRQLGEIAPARGDAGRTAVIVGRALGIAATTYRNGQHVLAAAAHEPETFGPILETMKVSGQVWPAYRKVRAIEDRRVPRTSKSRAAIEERRARIRQLADEGYRTATIAGQVGISEKTIRKLLQHLKIPTVETRIGKAARIDANRVMEQLVDQAIPSEHAIAAIFGSWAGLDRSRFVAWYAALSEAIRVFRRLQYKLKEETE